MENNKVNPINTGSAIATINVPALKYKSGNRIWYAVTISYKALGKFVNTSSTKKKNQEIIRSDIRNRFLDNTHKNEIKNYILEEKEFTIPPVTLVSFEPLDFRIHTFGNQTEEQANQNFENVGSCSGIVCLPIDYEFECLDGNHRTVAIRELANEKAEEVADSSILLNIVYENRARKIRQDFVDVNKNAKQTSSSINTLFNTRDKVSGLVVDIIEEIDYLKNTTELLATSVSKNSKDIYTINNIKNVVIELSGYNSQSTKAEKISNIFKENIEFENQIKQKTIMFFQKLKENEFIQESLTNREKTPEIRNISLITSGTGIIVAARVANYIFNSNDSEKQLQNLFNLDWSRTSKIFQGTIIGSGQKILNSRDAINTASNALIDQITAQTLNNN
ncbi:DNA sulfur modification protein DndB [Bacillus wiedmannii]|uniref:DNA sulfur modification protein DndB n=1 Tax=Bacillus wiedmannii TaxID=1890302 RepID=UPI000BF4B283|nr:DNA sulfur modification protein DndB [Bacillus wiedmannii]PGC10611.1 DNA sulfur modification protein DndB [Bacillus wiedmannii]